MAELAQVERDLPLRPSQKQRAVPASGPVGRWVPEFVADSRHRVHRPASKTVVATILPDPVAGAFRPD